MNLTLERVAYGKKDTPAMLREYKVKELPTSAVGTITEILCFLLENNIKIHGIKIVDKKGGI